MKNLIVSLPLLISIGIYANNRCLEDSSTTILRYYLMEKCYRSTLSVMARANYVSLTSCQRLGLERKGLALNFSPPEAMKFLKEGEQQPEFTCEVLKCAESENGLSLVYDTRFDYYSLYAKPLPHVNATCVPGIGIFSLLNKLNYTQALDECRNRSGSLANVMSEQRTDALAQLLSDAGVQVAFIGIRSENGSDYNALVGDSLDCVTYRAWEPGHPRKSRRKYGCVGVTRARTWRSLPCNTKIPAVCELVPHGPYKRGSIFASRHNDTMQNTTVTLPN